MDAKSSKQVFDKNMMPIIGMKLELLLEFHLY